MLLWFKGNIDAQIYTSKIAPVILEEQHRRCEILESQRVTMHGAGSSGTKSKKCAVAAACISIDLDDKEDEHSCSPRRNLKSLKITSTTLSTKEIKKEYSPVVKRQGLRKADLFWSRCKWCEVFEVGRGDNQIFGRRREKRAC